MRLSRFCPAVPLLPDLLHFVEHFQINDGRVRIVEDGSVFFRGFSLLLVQNGVRVGLEVDGTTGILLPL